MALRPSLTRGLLFRLLSKRDIGLILHTSQGLCSIVMIRYRFATRHSHFVAVDMSMINLGMVPWPHSLPRRCRAARKAPLTPGGEKPM